MNIKTLLRSAVFALGLISVITSHAAPVAIDSLFVDNAAVTLSSSTLGTDSASATLPSIEITMGSYQPSIFQVGSYPLTVNIYSAGPNSAPSGYVDGTSINVDFSSLRASIDYYGNNLDVGL